MRTTNTLSMRLGAGRMRPSRPCSNATRPDCGVWPALCVEVTSMKAQDLLQETLIHGFARLHSLESPHKIGGWLATALRRRAYSRSSASRRREELLEQMTLTDFGMPVPTPEQEFIATQVRQDIADATLRLSVESQNVFAAFHMDGRSIADISEETGISIGAVKARLFHSRQLVRKELVTKMPDRAITTHLPSSPTVEVMGEHEHMDDPLHPARLTRSLLSRHLLYACRKKPLDAGDLARLLQTRQDYIEDTLPDLVRSELLEEPLPERYQTAFLFR